MDNVPGDFIGRIGALLAAADSWSPVATLLGVGTLLFLLVWRRYVVRMPGNIVALLAATAVTALAALPVATVGSRS